MTDPRLGPQTTVPIDWPPAVTRIIANHYMASEEFQRQQAKGLSDLLEEVIVALKLPPGGDSSEGWVNGIYSIADLRKRLRTL